MSERLRGTVRRHYGTHCFVHDDVENRGYFLFAKGLQATTVPWEDVQEGDRVEFTPIEHPKGLRAIEARVIGR